MFFIKYNDYKLISNYYMREDITLCRKAKCVYKQDALHLTDLNKIYFYSPI